MLTVESLLDAIFNAKRLEKLQADVRDAMIKHLMNAEPEQSGEDEQRPQSISSTDFSSSAI